MSRYETDKLLRGTAAENLRPLEYARKWWIPRNAQNKPVSSATVYRWAKRGVCGIKLKVLFTADGAVTSEAAVRDFLRQVDAARRAEFAEKTSATPAQLATAGLSPGDKSKAQKLVTPARELDPGVDVKAEPKLEARAVG
jgi:hypothetical protein